MNLAEQYRAYIACLNERRWQDLGNFVDDGVHYNGERISLAGYRAMLENDVRIIPDLRFNIDLLVVEAPQIAARLLFNCSPQGRFLGLEARGQRIKFSENVFYTFADARSSASGRSLIKRQWSASFVAKRRAPRVTEAPE